jgi:hypothetical protein
MMTVVLYTLVVIGVVVGLLILLRFLTPGREAPIIGKE